MARVDLHNRIADRVYASRKKHWYQRWWGIVSIIGGFLIAVVLVVFGFLVSFYYDQISSGKLVSRAVDEIEQQARLDLLHNGEDPYVGALTAPVTIVAFEDFSCPFCKQAQPFLKELLAKYSGDIRFIYKDFPLTAIHPDAQRAAEAAQCAAAQGKFWEYHDELYANQDRFADAYYRALASELGLTITDFNECLASGATRLGINEDLKLGQSLGVQGTPTFFVNGELFAQGYSPALDQSFFDAIEYIKTL